MGKRPLSDFVDSRLKGQVDKEDFGAILQIAVLCVAKSSTGRPPIEVVFDELDKVYRDIEARKVLVLLIIICTSTLISAYCSFGPTKLTAVFYLCRRQPQQHQQQHQHQHQHLALTESSAKWSYMCV
jgi:hypothetical protein